MCVGSKAAVCYTPHNTKSSSHHLRVRTRLTVVLLHPLFSTRPRVLLPWGWHAALSPATFSTVGMRNAIVNGVPQHSDRRARGPAWRWQKHTCLCLASRPHLLPRRTKKDRKERAGRGGKSKSILSEFPQGLRGLWLPACSVFLQASQNTCEMH